MSGGWRESTERKVSFEDWDSGTVSRFIKFLYTGDYQYPDPEPLSLRKSIEREESNPIRGVESVSTGPEDDRPDPNTSLTPLGECFDFSLHAEKRRPRCERERLEAFGLSEIYYDYGTVLLAHARVYALAQYKDVTALRVLSLERLLMTLSSIHLYESCLDDHIAASIVGLLYYVYSHTDSPQNLEEPMRRVVSQFAALNFMALQEKQGMGDLLGEGGDLARDLMKKFRRRLAGSKKRACRDLVVKPLSGQHWGRVRQDTGSI